MPAGCPTRAIAGLAALLLICSGVRLRAQSDDPRIRQVEIASAALGRSLPLTIVVPAAPAGPDAPVLFFLHGRGRHHDSLLDSAAARAAVLAAPFYVVLPQGEDGWYIDSPAQPQDRYGTYLEEIVVWADKNLPVSRRRERRGIGGWSMGGFGAMRFAQTHVEQFGFVSSVMGLLDFPRAENLPEGRNYHVPTARFTADPTEWARWNPINAVASLNRTAVTLVLTTSGFERTMNENFLAALEAHRIPARVHWLEGGHEFSVVERAVPIMLADAAAFFRQDGWNLPVHDPALSPEKPRTRQ